MYIYICIYDLLYHCIALLQQSMTAALSFYKGQKCILNFEIRNKKENFYAKKALIKNDLVMMSA